MRLAQTLLAAASLSVLISTAGCAPGETAMANPAPQPAPPPVYRQPAPAYGEAPPSSYPPAYSEAPPAYDQTPPLVRLADRNGFKTGRSDGARDGYAGAPSRGTATRAYHDTPGYDPHLGPFEAYRDAFRNAYLRGYDEGYRRLP